MRIGIEQGMHTNMESQYLAEDVVERARELWWTVYTLGKNLVGWTPIPLSESALALALINSEARRSV